jgi:hypothetical protein
VRTRLRRLDIVKWTHRIKGFSMTRLLLASWLMIGITAALAGPDGQWSEGPGQFDERWPPPTGDPSWGSWQRGQLAPSVPAVDGNGLGGQAWQDPSRGAGQAWTGEPQYRFRGDPPPGSAARGAGPDHGGYRFRPLTDRETERRFETHGWRPLDPAREMRGETVDGRSAPPPGLMDALTPPPRTLGFEPNPWLGR